MGASGRHGSGRAHWRFHLTGGRLCLDLANTVSWRAGGRPIDRLPSYPELVSWARQAGVVTDPEARRLVAEAARRPREAGRVLGRARVLRDAIYRVFADRSAGRAPAAADVAAVNRELAEALGRFRIVLEGGRFS